VLHYRPPIAEYLFLLRDVFKIREYSHLQGYPDLDFNLIESIFEEAATLSREVLLPINGQGDRQSCSLDREGRVTTPQGFKEAYRIYREAGWTGLGVPEAQGGQNLPKIVTTAVLEFFGASNQAFDMYCGWGDSAATILGQYGSPALKELFLPRLVSGEWSGSMALTEAQAGTDVGLIKTTASPQANGTFRLNGTKVFNSGAEHDLTSNIVHFVLARVQGALPGVRGLSLFLAPTFMVDADGESTSRNGITCAAIESKMGLHGSATCEMQYTDAGAYLVGELNQGLTVMFRLMNHMRRRVGAIAVGVSELAYQNAREYVAGRLQGRAPSTTTRASETHADPLLEQPDVKRCLLQIAAFNEGARALLVWSSLLMDISERSSDASERHDAELRYAFLTPVLKGFLSDGAFANCVTAQQLYGGYGYVAGTGIEQLVRDVRLLSIAEGANGVQAFDLVSRQLRKGRGVAFRAIAAGIGRQIEQSSGGPSTVELANREAAALAEWERASMLLADPALSQAAVGIASSDYLYMTGLVLLGFMWLHITSSVRSGSYDAERGDDDRSRRLLRAQVFMERLLPETALRLRRIEESVLNLAMWPSHLV